MYSCKIWCVSSNIWLVSLFAASRWLHRAVADCCNRTRKLHGNACMICSTQGWLTHVLRSTMVASSSSALNSLTPPAGHTRRAACTASRLGARWPAL
ncbi:hypothetical protein COO60DRAFT_1514698 [Scenedesmus sp. NREL 46B-D3]|nr:hypothetical protein COO60DRAFT_1514698 [Scenedesmus sp. NREL 46B-D3]